MDNFESYIEAVENESLKPIALKLRELINGSSKEIKEEMKWNVPTYSIKKNICSIMVHKNHVNFQIFQGANLKDSKLLYGTGKNMRHLRYESFEQVDLKIVKNIIEQAITEDKKNENRAIY